MIAAVTQAIVGHLIRETADLGDWVRISALDANAKPAPGDDLLHVSLYAIDEHGYMRNAPLEESKDGRGLVRPPLFVRLSYVMAYFSNTPIEVQTRLARVLQTFHTTPALGPSELDPALAAQVEKVTIRLRDVSLDDRNRLWTALSRPMRLALYYDVDVAPIPNAQREGAGRVKALHVAYEVD